MDYASLHWRTFPELLEENNISWKFYQNEISIDVGFKDEQDPWLSNFQDNALEFFSQYNVRLHGKHLVQLLHIMDTYPKEIALERRQLENLQTSDSSYSTLKKSIEEKQQSLDNAIKEIKNITRKNTTVFLRQKRSLHHKAFVTNVNDPDYHKLETLTYQDNGTTRELTGSKRRSSSPVPRRCKYRETCRQFHGSPRRRIYPIILLLPGMEPGMYRR